ncbi:MAG TPA: hypothetical protein VES39_09580 [Rhodospirillales bacterium]|nr:hypothetical protein [Rhodospirillales bacterium]
MQTIAEGPPLAGEVRLALTTGSIRSTLQPNHSSCWRVHSETK